MEESNAQALLGSELDGRYRIISPLGEGGMGAVFLGEHILIGRQVAIKVLNPELAKSEDFLARFQREAIAAGRLDHPNCVPVTDSGSLADGTAYLVMELVSGKSLGAMLEEEGPGLDPIRALRILRHTLRGLGHAHNVGIVHRDIKPDNIMLSARENDSDFARVLDFGIAKLRDDDSKEKEALTQAGMAVGTPAYLSPEQALGDTIDHRSDLYSCAVVLFDMLCGRAPFVADQPMGVLMKHATADAPHLWDVAPHLQDLPSLDALVQRGLAKERDDRFQDADEFVAAIDQELLALGSQLTPPPGMQRTPPPEMLQRLGTVDTGLASVQRPTTSPTIGNDPTGLSTMAQANPTMPGMHPPNTATRLRQVLMAAILIGVIVTAVVVATRAGNQGQATLTPGVNVDAVLNTYQQQLRNGTTCEDRLQAVEQLHALGDKRAIPSLRKARRRMRGGLLGIGKKNTNRCLSKAAKQAIAELQNQ